MTAIATIPSAGRHCVFENDLSVGVNAMARAIGVRQAKDLVYALDEAPDFITGDSLLAHVFPAGDCASAIIELCRLAEAAIDGLDMAPIRELMYDLNDRPIRQQWSTTEHLLYVLADLTNGRHLTIEYTESEKRGVGRLLAALHLALCGPLPSHGWTTNGNSEIVGCDHCIEEHRTSTQSTVASDLAMSTLVGLLDPKWTPRVIPAGHKFGASLPPDERDIAARVAWAVPTEQLAQVVADHLRDRDFTVAIDRGHGRVIAQKPIRNGTIGTAMRASAKAFAHLAAADVQFCGAETVFSFDRDLFS